MSGIGQKTGIVKAAALLAMALLFAASASPARAGSGDITTGLLSHWTLNETSGTTAADSAGSNDGTMQGGMSAANDAADGRIDGGLAFDGTDDSIDTGFASDLSTYTVSAWVKADSDPSTASYSKITDRDANFSMNWNHMGMPTSCEHYDGAWRMAGATGLKGQTWYHITCTYDGTDIRMYVNGVEASSVAAAAPVSTPASILIGAHLSWAPDAFFAGVIDDVRLYNRALSATDVMALYQRSAKFCDSPTAAPGVMHYNADRSALQYCDGDNWVMMGLGSYTPAAVYFDGTNDYLLRGADLTGLADGKTVTGSLWLRRTTLGVAQKLYANTVATGPGFQLQLTSGGAVELQARNAADTEILRVNVQTTLITDSNWHHILFSIDTANSAGNKIYIDGVDQTLSYNTNINDTIDFTRANHAVGSLVTGSQKFPGDIADFWLDFNTFIDLSSAANRARFRSATGTPMYLGEDGSLPTGSTPDIFLSGDEPTWHVNRGTGGGFTETGALAVSSIHPAGGMLCFEGTWTSYYNNLAWDGIASSADASKLAGVVDGGQIYTSTNGGVNWTARESARQWEDIASSADGTVLAAVVDPGNIYVSTNSGVNWTARASSLAWSAVAVSTDGTRMAAAAEAGQIYVSTDGGVNWTGYESARDWYDIAMSADGMTLAATDNGGQIYVSTDGGANWTARESARNWRDITMSADGQKMAAIVHGGQIFTSADGGENWTARNSSRNWNAITSSSDGSKLAAAVGMTTAGQIYISIDSGVTWKAVETSRNWNGIASSADGLKLVAVVDAGKVHVSGCAGCTSPAGNSGTLIYNTDHKVLQYCNGRDWVATSKIGGTGGSGCASPAGNAGEILFNSADGVMQYCNSEDWVNIGKPVAPTDGLVGYWRMDETSGTTAVNAIGVDGAMSGSMNAATATIPGKAGSAFNFNGTSNFISMTDATLDLAGSLTVAAWIKPETFGTDVGGGIRAGGIYDRISGSSGYSLNIYEALGDDRLALYSSGNGNVFSDFNILTLNEWQHVAVTIDAGAATFYVNGVEAGTNAFPVTSAGAAVAAKIGVDSGEAEFFQGGIDDVRVYNRAFSPAEVKQLYEATR